MNAYELADKLEGKDRLWNVDEKLMIKTCNMLRQQADRIAELETLCANADSVIGYLRGELAKVKGQ